MLKNNLKTIDRADISAETRALVRVDFNVPIEGGEVRDGFRIKRALKTVRFLQGQGAKVVLMSHITDVDTLEPVSRFLSEHIPHVFVKDFTSEEGQGVLRSLASGEVAMVENLRLHDGEKSNDEDFARSLASLGDIYVNDAFSVSHREHASVVGVSRFLPSFAGFLITEEVANLERALSPEKPMLFILGGAKFETKIPLVERFLEIADTVLIGGALANDIYKSEGFEVGVSLVSDVDIENIAKDKNVLVPRRVIVLRGYDALTVESSDVEKEDLISDAAPDWVADLEEKINSAKTILWNGPLGNYEAGFSESSSVLAQIISRAPGFSIVGGGDTVALIEGLGIEKGFDFISTGGGAMLAFLSSGTLPGIETLKQ